MRHGVAARYAWRVTPLDDDSIRAIVRRMREAATKHRAVLEEPVASPGGDRWAMGYLEGQAAALEKAAAWVEEALLVRTRRPPPPKPE